MSNNLLVVVGILAAGLVWAVTRAHKPVNVQPDRLGINTSQARGGAYLNQSGSPDTVRGGGLTLPINYEAQFRASNQIAIEEGTYDPGKDWWA